MTDTAQHNQPAPEQEAACDTVEHKEKEEKSKKNKAGAKDAAQLAKQLEDAQICAQKQEEQLKELNNRLLRTMAEYDNYRKRSQKEKDLIFPEAIKTASETLLPVLDNFERALGAPTADEEFKKGIAMIFTMMQESFKKLGVEEIDALNQPFNPELHNAVMHVEDEALPESTVCEVFAKGYKLGDLVIRHAMVKVAN